MHHYYHDPNKLDLSVLRSDAENRARGRGIHQRHPSDSIIHFHAHGVQCGTQGCETYKVQGVTE